MFSTGLVSNADPAGYTENMIATVEKTARTQLFRTLEDDILWSVHQLGKPTAAQLFRLHKRTATYPQGVPHIEAMRAMLKGLSQGPERLLQCIKPVDPDVLGMKLPWVYIDTRLSRKRLEDVFGIPYRRVPSVPSCNWNYLVHDVELVDDLSGYEMTAKAHQLRHAYVPHISKPGEHLYPEVKISWEGVEATIKPAPDRTLINNDYIILHEKDRGHETLEPGNVLRDATVGRKHLVYEELIRMGFFRDLGFKDNQVLVVFSIDGLRRTEKSSRNRIKECIDKLPYPVNPKRTYFGTTQSFIRNMADLTQMTFQRADGKLGPLPCYK